MTDYKNVAPEQLKSWLDNDEAVLIDVREPAEYSGEHIKGALNVPLSSVNAQALPDVPGKKIVFQCASGNRSCRALDKVTASTNENQPFYNLEGGITGWKDKNYSTEKTGGLNLPVDRQVQVTIGFFVLLFTLLGYFIHPGYLFVPAFMGAGLLNAGLTGWCGMGKAMAKMPWNR